MSEPNRNESAWDRAKADSGAVYQSTVFQVVGPLVTVLLTAAATIISDSSGSAQTQIAVPVVAFVLGALLSLGAVLLFQLLAAPVRQRNEARSALNGREAIEPTNPDLALRNEIRKGDDLATRLGRQRTYVTSDMEEVEQWTERVVELLTAYSTPDAATSFMGVTRNHNGGPHSLISARLTKLDEIVGPRN